MRRNSRDRRQNEGAQDIAGNNDGAANDDNNDGSQDDGQQQQGIPAWQATLFEQRQNAQRVQDENARLQAELDRLRASSQQQQTQQVDLPQDTMLTNPNLFRQTIQQDIANQVAPLNAFAAEHQRQQTYHREKLNCMNDQSTGINQQAWQQLFPLLDPYFINNPSLVPSRQNIIQQAKVLIADYFLIASQNQNGNQNQQGNQGNQNNQNQNQSQNQNTNNQNRQNSQNNQSNMNPPHLRPTGRPSNQPQNTNNAEVFTENDRRLMRESNLTPGEYTLMRDTPPDQADAAWKKIVDARKANTRIQ